MEDSSNEKIAYTVERETLVIKRALNMQIKIDDVESNEKTYFTLNVTYKTRCVA